MKKIACVLALLAGLSLSLAGPALAQSQKDRLVQFYNAYLALVSSSDYVSTSRDEPEVWEAKFDAIAKQAGFDDAAAAMAAGADLSATDSDVASLRQAVTTEINQQYKPFQE